MDDPTEVFPALPGVVMDSLELLDVHAHHRVLDIGTGSGWTSVLLGRVVGGRNVITVEIDPQVAAQAWSFLSAAGDPPMLVCGDGETGYPDAAPYDRIHVGCGTADIPYRWIEQCRPGGLIVLPWHPGAGPGHVLRLTVLGDAEAIGSFHGLARHAMLHGQREAMTWTHGPRGNANNRVGTDPRAITAACQGAQLAIAALAPGIGWHSLSTESGEVSLHLFEVGHPGSAWARCDYRPGDRAFTVVQHGDRNLWDEVSDAYLRWCSWGWPTHNRFGLTLDEWHGPRLWLDTVDNVLTVNRPSEPKA
jgi:protein-L-isoaspartate(D-aspartate) O-methyltransferase